LNVDDCQCGYTAISRGALLRLPLSDLWPRFGYPNDLLCMLASRGLSVAEVPVRPVYAGEQSGVRFWHALTILLLIARRSVRERPVRRALSSGADSPIDDLLSEAE
ncbi:MAG: glycosyltransferase family 2 protein, partial [Polyangiaceae bacterium]